MANRHATITIRCTPDERAEWHLLAAEKGIDLSEYVRHMLSNRAALSRNQQLDLSHMDDEELVVAHKMVTNEAAQRLERLRRAVGEHSALVVLAANGVAF